MLFTSQNCRDFLGAELVRRIRTNASYSQRAFAKQLGVSPGELSEVMRGKRKLSLKSALRIAKGLGLSPSETRQLVFLVQKEKSKDWEGAQLIVESFEDELGPSQRLSMDSFNVISDWYHFAILSLMECEHFRWDPKWIASKLGIGTTEVRLGIERLIRVGLLRSVGNRLEATHADVASPEGIPSEAIRNYHQQILRKAIQALEEQSVSEREISGITLAVAKRSLPDFKHDVSQFLDKMGKKYGSGKKKQEVYQLETALFRLTTGAKP
jgi:uncharacterized protein (TIGR02147 family)